jgi:DNA-binding transcriptional regulator YhcF (GntR family)
MAKTITLVKVNHNSDTPKYQQIVTSIIDAISENTIEKGEALPSVNAVCKTHKLSRDTVFKAYSVLKEQGLVDAVPNKGYYVADDTKKVLLVLDTFKAYKEVLYHSFVNNLPKNVQSDVQFHHYDVDNFKTIITNSLGRYYRYIVMNFDHKDVPKIVSQISNDKLLQIDWNIHTDPKSNYVFQDFGSSFYQSISEAESALRKYKRIDFLYPNFSDHPLETLIHFKKFCEDFNFEYRLISDPKKFTIEKGVAYLSVSDRMLGRFLEQSKDKNLEPGVDVGFLSYNETPMKKFIYKGISVISTDFKALGTKAAEFITHNESTQCYVPTKLTLRESL